MNDLENANFICPFYSKKGTSSIECRDVIPAATVTVRFSKIGDYFRWKERLCKTFDYEKCPLYKLAVERMENE